MSAASNAGSALSLTQVSVAIDGRAVLSDVSLDLSRGEFAALVGPNGAGKTSLLRAMAGLAPTQGTIMLHGVDARGIAAQMRARAIAYLPQGSVVHWPARAIDIVRLGRMPWRGDAPTFGRADAPISGRGDARLTQDEAAVQQAIADCDIGAFVERRVDTLSGGERSRVLLARALATQAPILLADEPTAALDPAHRIAVMRLLRARADDGAAIVAATHDIALALDYATRVIVVAQGRIAGDGDGRALIDAGVFDRVFGVRFTHGAQDDVSFVATRHADAPPRR